MIIQEKLNNHGGVAQMVERPLSMREVRGSMPRSSSIFNHLWKLRAAGVSYTELAVFALTGLPMSTKILFSAFIDSTYFEKLGRRKTWVLIAQLGLAGVFVVFYFFFGWYSNLSQIKILEVTITVLVDIVHPIFCLEKMRRRN